MRLVRNVKTLIRQPEIGRDYACYWLNRLAHNGKCTRKLFGDVKISEINSFNEFHHVAKLISGEEQAFLAKYPLGDGDIIDVGANIGVVSIFLAKRFPNRIIHSFEPAPITFQALQTNTALNFCKNIVPMQCAISDSDGELTFNAHPISRATNKIASEGDFLITVPSMTLDSYVQSKAIERISLLKVDVEGYEALVFGGAQRILERQQAKVIYYEVCPENAHKTGFDPALATRMLQEQGYDIFELDKGGSLKPIHPSSINQTVLANWVAVCL